MVQMDFGRFRVTPATLWRPQREVFAPTYRVPAATYDDLRAIERADQELRRHQPDAARTRRLLEDALTRNAYGTASIEGNPLTLDQVESLLAAPPPQSLPEEREILNYAAFIERLALAPAPRAPGDVRALHAQLFVDVLPDAGSFKDRPNFVGRRPQLEVVYVPTPPERVEPELQSALEWLQDAPEHPLVRIIVFFHELQGIHPFRDGNGRVGRALTTLLMHQAGYEGVRYALIDYRFNEDREAYYGTLADMERRDWDFTPWIVYMARVLRETFEAAVARFLFDEALPASLNARQRAIAQWLARLTRDKPDTRVKFADVHAAFPTIADRTLKRDLATLRDEHVLHMQGERKGATYELARRPPPPSAVRADQGA